MRPDVRARALALLVTALPSAAVRAGAQAPTPPPSVAESRRTGTVSGRVVDRVSQRPIPDVRVTITELDLEARSDANGGFTLRGVPAGTHRVRAVLVGYRPGLAPDVSVSAGYPAQVRFELQRLETTLAAVRVGSDAAALAPPPDAPVTTITLTADLVRRAPGALADVSRLVQSLPGVAAGNDQRNDIIARGGAPSENLFLIDGFEVPGINHFGAQGTSGGGIGMFHNELLAQATFHAGAFPSQYGNRLSAVLDLRQRDGDRERWRSQADMSLAGVGLIVEGPIGRRASVIASAREGYF
ncbi:MAG: carboxypeptidase regulatory-like domain-containing protein, partial [Gemmatimonadaceae bacterium]